MHSRLNNDPDMVYFAHRLQDSRAGRDYIAAWQEQENCLRNLRTALQAKNAVQIGKWRRAYIKASSACTHRLQVLENAHSWPSI